MCRNGNDDALLTAEAREKDAQPRLHLPPQPDNYVFFDKLKFRFACSHDMTVARRLKHIVDLDGVAANTYADRLWVPGPHGDALVRSVDPPHNTQLEIELCPGTYFQGHNAWASNDLLGLCHAAGVDVANRCGITLSADEEERLRLGQFLLQRVDITAMVDVGSQERARALLTRLGYARHIRLRGEVSHEEDTRRWDGSEYSFKVYDKRGVLGRGVGWGHDIDAADKEAVLEAVTDMMRVEMSLKYQYLKRHGLEDPRNWTTDTTVRLLRDQLDCIEVTDSWVVPPEVLEAMERRHRVAIRYWQGGGKLQELYDSPESRNRIKREIHEVYGLDIAVPYKRRPKKSDQIYNAQLLEQLKLGNFIHVPQTLIDRGLLYQPSAQVIC